MKHKLFRLFFFSGIASATLLPGIALAQEHEASPLRLVQSLPLPGVNGRLDHFTIDKQRKRIIFSCPDDKAVQIVDAFDGSQIHRIEGLSEPRGTFYLPEEDKIYVADATGGRVNVYDGEKFTLIAAIDFGKHPDNLQFDAWTKRLYVGYGDGAIGVIDVTTNKRLDINYKLGGHPEGFQLATKGPQIFVNVAGQNDVTLIDRTTGKVNQWAVPAGHSANLPMALDEAHRCLLIGASKPPRLIVMNTDTHAVVASLPVKGDIDGISFTTANASASTLQAAKDF